MEVDIFTQLSLVIVVATIVALVMSRLRQPLIIGHILTGIIVGPSVLHLIEMEDSFEVFSEIGIALLLFIIGLELSVSAIKRLGKPVVLTALALLSTVGTLGYLVALALQFTRSEALIVGLALFFSSTIIIAKVLSDKKELNRLNGHIAIGVILLDDIIATFALLFVAAKSGDSLTGYELGLLVLKGVTFMATLVVFGSKVLPRITRHVARSQELLFMFALAWGFGVASLVSAIGFSMEIGALFAGVALAHLPYTHQIGARLKPLRDFFLILFFISLGERLEITNVGDSLVHALILSFIVMVIKPLTVMTSLGLLGYTKRTSFKTGINLSQVSEFSIILIVLASSGGLISDELVAIMTLVAMITIAISTYLMKYDDWIYANFEKNLHLFERKITTEEPVKENSYELILFGYQQGGHQFLKTFRRMKKPYIVVDYDPDVIEELKAKHIPHMYGDVSDMELLNEINLDKTKLIINTVDEHSINLALMKHVAKHNPSTAVVCYSNTHEEAEELYEAGAAFVLLPHAVGNAQLNNFLHNNGTDREGFQKYRQQQLLKITKHL